MDKELPKYALRLPGYERNYCEIKALVDDVKSLGLEKVIKVPRSLSGSPLIIGCIQNEPSGVADYSQPWPLKGLMDDIINKNSEDVLFLKDDFNEDLLVHAF